MHFSKFSPDFVNWNAEMGQQEKNVLSSMVRKEKYSFSNKNSGFDMEKQIFESFPIFTIFVLNRFGVRLLRNVQERLNSFFLRVLKEHLQTSIGKWLKVDRKKS